MHLFLLYSFKFFLKIPTEVSLLRYKNKVFHTEGAEKEKLLSPRVLNFVIFCLKNFEELYLRALEGTFTSIKSDRYLGTSPFKHLKVSKALLKSDRVSKKTKTTVRFR